MRSAVAVVLAATTTGIAAWLAKEYEMPEVMLMSPPFVAAMIGILCQQWLRSLVIGVAFGIGIALVMVKDAKTYPEIGLIYVAGCGLIAVLVTLGGMRRIKMKSGRTDEIVRP